MEDKSHSYSTVGYHYMGIMCMHLEDAYADIPLPHDLTRSEEARDGTVLLPLFAQMSFDQLDMVVQALANALADQRAPLRAMA